MRSLLSSLAVAAALLGTPSPGKAWGVNGHAMIADLAMVILSDAKTGSPVTVETLQRLLPYAHRVGVDTLPVSSIADIASTPDSARAGPHPETAPWHFVDIPLQATRYDALRDCHFAADGKTTVAEETCIVAKLPEMVVLLADKTKSDEERGYALAYVVHLVGDIHQPLHDEDDNDKGGGDRKFIWRGGANPTNLHVIWDSVMIDEQFGLPVAHKDPDPNKDYKIDLRPAAAAIKRLDPAACSDKPDSWVKAGVIKNMKEAARAWAEESHMLAPAIYTNLPAGFPTGWEDAYANYADPVIDCQLQKAGARLAEVLREALS